MTRPPTSLPSDGACRRGLLLTLALVGLPGCPTVTSTECISADDCAAGQACVDWQCVSGADVSGPYTEIGVGDDTDVSPAPDGDADVLPPRPAELCLDIRCGPGYCAVVDGAPRCLCPSGYRVDETTCVGGVPPDCDDVDCGPEGECVIDPDNSRPRCECQDGYVDVGLDCVPVPPAPSGSEVCLDEDRCFELQSEDPMDDITGLVLDDRPPSFGSDGIPPAVDHREAYLAAHCPVTSNQGGCGWCVAHAVTHQIEALQCREGQDAVRVSEPHLWYAGGKDLDNCRGGWWISTAIVVASLTRLVDDEAWPYFPAAVRTEVPAPDVLAAARITARIPRAVTHGSADELKAAIADGNDVVYSLPVFGTRVGDRCFAANEWRYHDPGGTIDLPRGDQDDLCGYHAILFVGYDDGDETFLFRNSWGADWPNGDANGYARMTYRYVDEYGRGGAYLTSVDVADLERCNGRDDDGDGEIDEDFDLDSVCTVGVGICQQSGRSVCNGAGDGAECDVEPAPPETELCGNQLDDNCDGDIDEGFEVGESCTSGAGICQRAGRLVCNEAGDDVECGIGPGEPGTELCGNLLDDDCDGTIDEGFDRTGEACTVGRGACQADAHLQCNAVRDALECDAIPGEPGIELCGDEIDGDCDGEPDNGFNLGQVCFAGEGACRRRGDRVCNEARDDTVCNAVPGEPVDEVCDGIDNNCDNVIDRLSRPCQTGLPGCPAGTEVCIDGQWGRCVPEGCLTVTGTFDPGPMPSTAGGRWRVRDPQFVAAPANTPMQGQDGAGPSYGLGRGAFSTSASQTLSTHEISQPNGGGNP